MSSDTQPRPPSRPPADQPGMMLGYALRAPVVYYIAVIAGVRLLADWLVPSVFWLVHDLIVVFLVVASWKVAYEILIASAKGRFQSPDVRVGEVNDWIFLRQCLLWAIMLGLAVAVYLRLGPVAGLVVGSAACFFLPAATITLAMEQSVSLALVPTTWIEMIRRTGLSAYVGLTLVLGLLTVVTSFVTPWLASVLPGWLIRGPVYLVGLYSLFTMFHLMGVFVWRHQHVFGLDAVEALEPRATEGEAPEAGEPAVEAANKLATAGDLEGAIETLSNELAARGGAVALHEALRGHLVAQGNARSILEHGAFYVSVLMDQNMAKAVTVAGEYLNRDASFRLRKPTQTVELAHAAYEKGLRRYALMLTRPFLEDYADHSRIEDMLWLHARLEWEENMDAKAALESLEDLLTRFPTGSHVQEARLLQVDINAHVDGA